MPMKKLHYSNKNHIICPRVCSRFDLNNEFIGSILSSKKAEGRTCRPMCQICFNDDAEPMLYVRYRVQIDNRKRGTFYERSRKNEFKSKNVTQKRKHNNTSDKILEFFNRS